MKERRSPSVLVAGEGDVLPVPAHPDDDCAEAEPGVEPGANAKHFLDALKLIHEVVTRTRPGRSRRVQGRPFSNSEPSVAQPNDLMSEGASSARRRR